MSLRENQNMHFTYEHPLCAAISRKAQEKNLTIREAMLDIGLTKGFFDALANGTRKPENCESGTLKKISKFLGCSVFQVYLLAGIMTPSEMIFQQTAEQQLDHVLKTMMLDSYWSVFVPKEWHSLSQDTKFLIALLYQEASRKSLLDFGEVTIPEENLLKK